MKVCESLTKERVFEICKKWEEELNVKVKRIQIRKMKKKWASCSTKGTLTLNNQLLDMPIEYVDYVVLHELLHLIVPHHGRIFKALLSTYMPRWEELHLNLKNFAGDNDTIEVQ